MIERKPLAEAEDLVQSTVRLHRRTWRRVDEQATLRGHLRLTFLRILVEYALDIIEEQARVEATVGTLRKSLRDSQRVRRI